MAAITGRITPYLHALGAAPTDPATKALLDAQSGERTTERFTELDRHYETFEAAGTSFLFKEERLAAVFFCLESLHGYTAYAAEGSLIDGLADRATFDEVRATLGEPYWFDADAFDVYKVADGQYVHLEYDMEMRVRQITLMRRVPGKP